MKTNSIC